MWWRRLRRRRRGGFDWGWVIDWICVDLWNFVEGFLGFDFGWVFGGFFNVI
jgi:hypothetical protein